MSSLLDRLDVLRRDTRRVLVAAALAVVVLAVAGVTYARSTREDDVATACRAAGDDVNDIWGAGRQQTLAAAFAAFPEAFAADAWADVQRSVQSWTAAMDHSRYDEAGRAIESARMIAHRLPADERRDVSIAVQESLLAFWRGEYDRCVTVSKATIEQITRVLGPTAIEGVIVREKLMHCLQKQDKTDEAEAIGREALAIADASIGREHPVVADVLKMLAYEVSNQGRMDEAFSLLQEALGIRERTLGPENPLVGLSHTDLGNFLVAMGRVREARSHLERAAAIIEPAWGADSPALAMTERVLSDVAEELGEPDEAERHLRRALAIYVAKRPPGHDEITHTQARLGSVLVDEGNRDGLSLLEAAVDAIAKSPGVRPHSAARARFNLGRALVKFDDPTRGRALIKESCVVLLAEPDLFPREAQACRDLGHGAKGPTRWRRFSDSVTIVSSSENTVPGTPDDETRTRTRTSAVGHRSISTARRLARGRPTFPK